MFSKLNSIFSDVNSRHIERWLEVFKSSWFINYEIMLTNLPMLQSLPLNPALQTHICKSSSNIPWSLQLDLQIESVSSQNSPFQPLRQWHCPFIQNPWSEHVGSKQSTEKINWYLLFLSNFLAHFFAYS